MVEPTIPNHLSRTHITETLTVEPTVVKLMVEPTAQKLLWYIRSYGISYVSSIEYPFQAPKTQFLGPAHEEEEEEEEEEGRKMLRKREWGRMRRNRRKANGKKIRRIRVRKQD
jgi:hypothetical protein